MIDTRLISEAGVVEGVLAHRFVLRRHDGTRIRADLGPEAPAADTGKWADAIAAVA